MMNVRVPRQEAASALEWYSGSRRRRGLAHRAAALIEMVYTCSGTPGQPLDYLGMTIERRQCPSGWAAAVNVVGLLAFEAVRPALRCRMGRSERDRAHMRSGARVAAPRSARPPLPKPRGQADAAAPASSSATSASVGKNESSRRRAVARQASVSRSSAPTAPAIEPLNLISGRSSRPAARSACTQRSTLVPYEINRLWLSRSFQITKFLAYRFRELRCGLLWSMAIAKPLSPRRTDRRERARRAIAAHDPTRQEAATCDETDLCEQGAIEIGGRSRRRQRFLIASDAGRERARRPVHELISEVTAQDPARSRADMASYSV